MKIYEIKITGSGSIEQIAGALEDMAIHIRKGYVWMDPKATKGEYEDSILCAVVTEKEE